MRPAATRARIRFIVVLREVREFGSGLASPGVIRRESLDLRDDLRGGGAQVLAEDGAVLIGDEGHDARVTVVGRKCQHREFLRRILDLEPSVEISAIWCR